MFLYLDVEDYLKQWFINDMGGKNPVELRRGCAEFSYLELYLTTPPADYEPEVFSDDKLAIKLPNYRSKDTRDNYYLPPAARIGLLSIIRNRFDIEMWKHIHVFASLFKRLDKVVEAFMEKSGIEINDKNWNAVIKRYRRKRDIYGRVMRQKKTKK